MVSSQHDTSHITATSPPCTIPKKAKTNSTKYVRFKSTDLPTKLTSIQRLKTQLENLSVPFTNDFNGALSNSHLLIDAIFGFSFGGPLREPFPSIISQIETASIPVLSVDAPSSWDITSGPPSSGPGAKFMPQGLISLTAPKPCVKFYEGRHFVGGRFLTQSIAEKYGLVCPAYEGIDQVVEVFKDGDGDFRYAPKGESKC